ncbi:glycosyltransferase family 4 protein [Ornithinimicrobium sediminis]|uniref:glycosyltransferase family 4 protein n=1 Tax=Ornithinimicrobium sediminis TaxID=2904603 RepID=UPI001E3D4DD6|nr:glycosyltransferase family 4 protein [Ornithinimicrobium sediminis]MCE0486884.1 glycosyltransferase family 4 protein [Ornithinimicrobium sediminis]
MRVLHAIRSDGFAGVERHVCVLASAQCEAGIQVTVVGGDPDRMRGALPHAVTTVPARTTLQVARAVRGAPADLVHAHMTAAELGATTATTGRQTPVVVTRHFAGPRGRSAGGALAARMVKPRVSGQIAISGYVASRIEGRSTVIYPGLLPRPLGTADVRGPRVLVAQRLEAEKATNVAVQAFAGSGLAGLGWRLVVAGVGRQSAALEELAAAVGVSAAVDFVGRLSDLEATMDTSSMLVAPCPVEGFGLTVLEAMAGGLPVVAAAAGAHLETVGVAESARLFTPGDVQAAGAQLRDLAGSEESRTAYGATLRDVQLERFSLDRQVRDTLAFYDSVLA